MASDEKLLQRNKQFKGEELKYFVLKVRKNIPARLYASIVYFFLFSMFNQKKCDILKNYFNIHNIPSSSRKIPSCQAQLYNRYHNTLLFVSKTKKVMSRYPVRFYKNYCVFRRSSNPLRSIPCLACYIRLNDVSHFNCY